MTCVGKTCFCFKISKKIENKAAYKSELQRGNKNNLESTDNNKPPAKLEETITKIATIRDQTDPG